MNTNETEKTNVQRSRRQKIYTKSKLIEDCRIKINCVLEARLNLLELQTVYLTEDQKKKEEITLLK